MKSKIIMTAILMMSFTTLFVISASARKIKKEPIVYAKYGESNNGSSLEIKFEKGAEHNHPLFAIWLADEKGVYIQPLYVSESIGNGVFKRTNRKAGHWQAGEIQRPAALPYWVHQRGILNEFGAYNPTPQKPEVDAYTGATPNGSFILNSITEKPLNGKYKVMLELNQSWDWNEFWYNNRYPEDKEFKTSSQPALVYSVDIDTDKPQDEYVMNVIGRSHYSGEDGKLYEDLTTMTTALKIAKRITVKIK